MQFAIRDPITKTFSGPRGRRITVCHLISSLEGGGAQRVLEQLLRSLGAGRFRSVIVSFKDRGVMGERLEAAGAELVELNLHVAAQVPSGLWRLVRLLRRLEPDVVQTWMYHADLLGGLASALLVPSVPVVWNIRHGDINREFDKRRTVGIAAVSAKLSRRLPAKIITCSEAARSAHGRLGYALDKIEVIPNGFDTVQFRPDLARRLEVRAELGIDPSAPVLGMVGRFHPVKDHRTLFEALAKLKARFKRMYCVLCGEGVTEKNEQLLAWARDAGIGARCRFLGRRDDTHRLWAGIDLAVSSSRTEAFPNTIGEAMACGVPCVATEVGDSALLIGKTGIVVPPRCPGALAAAVGTMFGMTPDTRCALGEMARRRIERHYSQSLVAERYSALYEGLTEPLTCERFSKC